MSALARLLNSAYSPSPSYHPLTKDNPKCKELAERQAACAEAMRRRGMRLLLAGGEWSNWRTVDVAATVREAQAVPQVFRSRR